MCKLPQRVVGELGGPKTDRVQAALDEGWAEIIDAPSPTDGDPVAASDIAMRTIANETGQSEVPDTYLYLVAQYQTVSEITKQDMTVCIDVNPADDLDIFRIAAADDILRLLADAHEAEFTIPELVNATDVTRSTVWRAVDLLDGIGVVRVRETPQRNYVAINPQRLQKDDPILAIEQTEFHAPIRAFVERTRVAIADADTVADLLGIVVFGSVARGEADRQSDIDLFVVVDGDRTTARRLVTDVVSNLSERRFDGDRFDFEPYVESEESTQRAGSKLREIFQEGITVYGDDRIQSVRKAVFADE